MKKKENGGCNPPLSTDWHKPTNQKKLSFLRVLRLRSLSRRNWVPTDSPFRFVMSSSEAGFDVGMRIGISALMFGVPALVFGMLALGTVSSPIAPSTSDTLTNWGIGLAVLLVLGTVLAKFR